MKTLLHLNRPLQISGLIISLAFTSGCASVNRTSSGALTDYSRLQADETKQVRSFADLSRLRATRHRTVYLEPVRCTLLPDDPRLSDPQRTALLADASEALVRAFNPYFEVVSTPTPDALRVRFVITDVNTSNPVLNAVTMAVAFVPFDPGAVSVEAEVLDADSGRQLFARCQSRAATPLDAFAGLRRTGQAAKGFAQIAREFARELHTAVLGDATTG